MFGDLNPVGGLRRGWVSYTKAQILLDAANVYWDASQGNVATETLGGNRVLVKPYNAPNGNYILYLVQDGTGNRTVTWWSDIRWALGVDPVLSTAAGAIDLFSFTVKDGIWYGSYLKGMAQ